MKKTTIISITLVLAIVALFFANLAWGSVSIPLREVLSILTHPGVDMTPADSYYPNETIESMSYYIVMESRLPNAITALLAGADSCCKLPSAIPWRGLTCSASAAEQHWLWRW